MRECENMREEIRSKTKSSVRQKRGRRDDMRNEDTYDESPLFEGERE